MLRQRPKILFVGPYPPPYAGPESAMKILFESSINDSFELHLLRTNVRKSNIAKGKFDLTMIVSFFSFISRLLKEFIFFRPRIVYHFVTATKLGWLGRDIWLIFLSRLFLKKVVIHMRAGHFKQNFDAMAPFEQWLVKLACSSVQAGIVQAQILKNQFAGLVKKKHLHYVYNAIDVSVYDNPEPEHYDPYKFLFLGHLSFAKGYCDLLQAIPQILEKYPACKFYFAGTPIEIENNVFQNQETGEFLSIIGAEECKNKFLLNEFEDSYIYLGVLNEEEKIRHLRDSNALILPSYSEGFSMAILEAMSVGKPVVCSTVGALSEVVHDGVNGFTFQPGDVNGLASAVIKLLHNQPARDEIACTNYWMVRKKFTQDIISHQLVEIFKRA